MILIKVDFPLPVFPINVIFLSDHKIYIIQNIIVSIVAEINIFKLIL